MKKDIRPFKIAFDLNNLFSHIDDEIMKKVKKELDLEEILDN